MRVLLANNPAAEKTEQEPKPATRTDLTICASYVYLVTDSADAAPSGAAANSHYATPPHMSLPLSLDRPLVSLDLEATSTDPENARIFQLAAIRHEPGGNKIEYNQMFDPVVVIPDHVEKLTGITEEDVSGKPMLTDCIGEIKSLIEGADLIGHNIREYDLPLLRAAFNRCGKDFPPPKGRTVLDTMVIEQELSSLSLESLYRLYKGEELEGSHQADKDAKAVLDVLSGQSEVFGISGLSPQEIEENVLDTYLDPSRNFLKENSQIIFQFGKHYGETLSDVQAEDQSYIDWMIHPENYDDLGTYVEPHL
jgi:DNA polymerase-3 subunit epsilon